MNLLLAHNRYLEPGGEDAVFVEEHTLLNRYGHSVFEYMRSNDEMKEKPGLTTAYQAIWNEPVRQNVRRLIKNNNISIIHVHNTLACISPAIYYAAYDENIPVVQTLHNFRVLCPNAIFYREGNICELCVNKVFASYGLRYKCYRNSYAATATVAMMSSVHKLLGTWHEKIDVYIALSHFARGKFIAGGLPEEKIVVKPNFLGYDPGEGSHNGGYVLYVGRLAQEKGISTLIDAWRQVNAKKQLLIAGGGPLSEMVNKAALRDNTIRYLGFQGDDSIISLMREAEFLILPSLWYENFPMVAIEAYATGLPILASNHGSLKEIIQENVTGDLFEPGNAADLARKIDFMVSDPARLVEMGRAARAEYEAKYTAEKNYEMLMAIYQKALGSVSSRRG